MLLQRLFSPIFSPKIDMAYQEKILIYQMPESRMIRPGNYTLSSLGKIRKLEAMRYDFNVFLSKKKAGYPLQRGTGFSGPRGKFAFFGRGPLRVLETAGFPEIGPRAEISGAAKNPGGFGTRKWAGTTFGKHPVELGDALGEATNGRIFWSPKGVCGVNTGEPRRGTPL